MEDSTNVTVEIDGLKFTYPGIDGHPPPGSTPLIENLSLKLNAGDRCLLVGSNGAGKTTLLKILGGKHMVEPHMVRVLGRSAFHDTYLTSSGALSYLGGEWKRDVAFAGFEVSIQMDVSAEKMIFGVSGSDPERRAELIKVLDIDLNWRMHKVSDGQKRRVQICMGLLKPFKVLLLDEITVDLDVLARANLLNFLKKECEQRGATIIYATHIFDGLETWPTHIAYVADGRLQLFLPMDKLKEISDLSLMRTVESWLRKARDEDRKRRQERKEKGLPEFGKRVEGTRVVGDPARTAVKPLNNGWAGGRLNSTVAVSWEAVEDVALMSAWVYVSGDPIINQKGDSLWEPIYKMYEKYREENPNKLSKRTVESMRARWSRLNKNVTKWIGCYKEAYSQKTSGMSMEDVGTMAHRLYNKKKGFPHTLVFEKVMRHVPKWELNYGGGTRRPHPDATESDEEGHGSSKKSKIDKDDCPSDTSVSGASIISRPADRYATKAKRKRKAMASSSTSNVIPDEFINELRAMRITREKELEVRIELEQKKLNANLLNALLAKPNLTTQEEAIKNRLLAEYFN